MKQFRWIALALAVVMSIALFTGCGTAKKPEVTDAGNPAATDSADNADANTNTDSDSEETIKVGILAPLTGGVADYGLGVRNGAALYLDQLNAQGGINGKKVEYIEYDEEGDAGKALTGYNHLMDQGIVGLIGDVTSLPTLAVVPEAAADNLPMITASATAPGVTYDDETDTLYANVFRSCFIDSFQGEKMALFAKEELDVKTAAILYNNGDDYSIGLTEAFEAKAEELGIEIVATEAFAPKAKDFQGQLTNIAAKNPELLFIPTYYEEVSLIAQQIQGTNMDPILLGVDGWDSVLDVIADPSLVEGAYYCSGYSRVDTNENVQKFLTDFKAAYNTEPNMFAAQAYDAAKILTDAILVAEEAGLEAGSEEYKQAVIDAMKATNAEGITGSIKYDDKNNPEKTAVIINVKDGKASFWGKF